MAAGSSYNGWAANSDPNAIGIDRAFSVAGTNPFGSGGFVGGVKSGPVATVFHYLISRLHNEVEPMMTDPKTGQLGYGCWGYSYRANVNNPSTLSCHASGTAIDYNAPRHANGTRTGPNGGGGWTGDQYRKVQAILSDLGGVVAWLTSNDPMHFEIRGSAAAVAAVAARLGGAPAPTPPPAPAPPAPPVNPGDFPLPAGYYYGPKSGPTESISGMAGEAAAWVEGLRNAQRRLMAHGFGLPQYGADGKYGNDASGETHDATVAFQRARGLEADGLIGAATWAALQATPPAAPAPAPAPAPPAPQPAPIPPFPLPAGYYYGPKSGPNESISGMAGEPEAWVEGLRAAQRRLMLHLPGCLPQYGADGKYGRDASGETHDATRTFQAVSGRGLAVDGLIGPNTWKELHR